MFALKQALKLYEFYQKQLRECETQIELCLRGMEDKSRGAALPASVRKRRRQPEKNEVRFGVRALLFQMAGVDLTVLAKSLAKRAARLGYKLVPVTVPT